MMYNSCSQLAYAGQEPFALDYYLKLACNQVPTMARTLKRYGDAPLAQYLESLHVSSVTPYQDRGDLCEALRDYTAPLVGEEVAALVARDLEENPFILTVNHHGVDYFAQSVQGTLLFGLSRKMGARPARTVPILSCSNIPLNNLTYPMGMYLYQLTGQQVEDIPKKLPVFSNRYKRSMVSAVCGFDKDMVGRAGKRMKTMLAQGEVSEGLAACVQQILTQDYAADAVLNLACHSDQVVVLNDRIWRRLFKQSSLMPPIVPMDLEKVVSKVLERDLFDDRSLAWQVFFDDQVRSGVLRELEGHRTCWTSQQLEQRAARICSDTTLAELSNRCGTHFFWGVDECCRKVPLSLDLSCPGCPMLRGVDDGGRVWEVPFSPVGICAALRGRKLIPSLFTCYMVLALARGVVCIGGYYQTAYLPLMQSAVVTALQSARGDDNLVKSIREVPTNVYLSGMQTVMTVVDEAYLVPAGPLEIIAGGGLTESDLERILSLTVRDAHLASLLETVPDVAPEEVKDRAWKSELAAESYRLLGNRVVVK